MMAVFSFPPAARSIAFWYASFCPLSAIHWATTVVPAGNDVSSSPDTRTDRFLPE